MNKEQFEKEMVSEMQDLQSEDTMDAEADRVITNQEFQEAYGSPEPEQTFNQHAFLAGSLDIPDNEKVTYLNLSELGRPLFNLRFLLDLEDICKHYLDPVIIQMGGNPKVDNRIANYFREKIENITSSGMSNKGFAMNLSVTKKMDTMRRRVRDLPPIQGGKSK